MPLIALYKDALEKGELRADPAQERAVARLNTLAQQLGEKPDFFASCRAKVFRRVTACSCAGSARNSPLATASRYSAISGIRRAP